MPRPHSAHKSHKSYTSSTARPVIGAADGIRAFRMIARGRIIVLTVITQKFRWTLLTHPPLMKTLFPTCSSAIGNFLHIIFAFHL